MSDNKASKEAPKKSPQATKVKLTSTYTPPTLRQTAYTTHTDMPSQEIALRELRSSMELAFQRVHEKIDAMLNNQQQMLGRIDALEATQKDLEQSAAFLSSSVDDLKADQSKLEMKIQSVEKQVIELDKLHRDLQKLCEEKVKSISEAQLKAERYSRSFNLRFGGIPEKQGESSMSEVQNILRNHLKLENIVIENAHRIGRQRLDKPRHIITKLLYRPQRQEVLSVARRSLANTIFLSQKI